MKYKPKHHESAFTIWAACDNFEEVALEMRRKFPKACGSMRRQTLYSWAKHDNWEQRLANIKDAVRQHTDAEVVSEQIALQHKYRTLINKSYEVATQKHPKTFAEAINAFKGLAPHYYEMIAPAKRGGTTNIDKVLIMFLEVMSDDHELGKRFEKRLPLLRDELLKRLDDAKN